MLSKPECDQERILGVYYLYLVLVAKINYSCEVFTYLAVHTQIFLEIMFTHLGPRLFASRVEL